MSTDNNVAIGWDEERIEQPNEGSDFITLPDGKYNFSVEKFERGRFEGSAKMCACPKAVLTLAIDAAELGTVNHKHNLYLNKKCEGLLCQFFVSVGLRKHGDPLVLAWNQLVGRSGVCEMGQRVHKDNTYNDVKKFLDPPEQSEAPAQETEEIPF
jgi:hypothetical protein